MKTKEYYAYIKETSSLGFFDSLLYLKSVIPQSHIILIIKGPSLDSRLATKITCEI